MFPRNWHEMDDTPLGEPEPPTDCSLSMPGCEGDATQTIRDGDEPLRVCVNCEHWWYERYPAA